MDVIENEQKYLWEKGDPNYRLSLAHSQNENKREVVRKGFDDTVEFQAEIKRWKEEKEINVNANIPLLKINQLHRAHLQNIEDLKRRFDKGELTALHPIEKQKTALEQAQIDLDKAVAGMNEVVAKGKELLSR